MSGALLGTGLLAIWNGMAPGHEAEFIRWHVVEHIPERLTVPGFLRARRYHALEGAPAFFNFYEVAAPDVLSSAAYVARLNDPTGWTRSVVPHFTDTSRTICRVVESRGHGAAGTLCALRMTTGAAPLGPLVERLAEAPEVAAVHLLERAGRAPGTAESKMRDRPDESAASILLIEGADRAALSAVLAATASDDIIRESTGAAPTHRGLYQLDFIMRCGDAV